MYLTSGLTVDIFLQLLCVYFLAHFLVVLTVFSALIIGRNITVTVYTISRSGIGEAKILAGHLATSCLYSSSGAERETFFTFPFVSPIPVARASTF